MTDFRAKLNGLRLPFWMSEGEPARLLAVARQFWLRIWEAITWPLRQSDPLTCCEPLLMLTAWQSDINRFNNEPLALFRKRVAYAFINARDAGTVAGFIAIFDRLGIGYVELLERQPGTDWDIITVRVTDSQIAASPELLMLIIQQYGRSCRRYRFEVITTTKIAISAGWCGGEYVVYPGRLLVANSLAMRAGSFGGRYNVCSASLMAKTTNSATGR